VSPILFVLLNTIVMGGGIIDSHVAKIVTYEVVYQSKLSSFMTTSHHKFVRMQKISYFVPIIVHGANMSREDNTCKLVS
jgi:hypothetical protein